MYIEYLRYVHLFCYYCGSESDSVEELSRKCPGRHLRSLVGIDPKNPSKNAKDKQINGMLQSYSIYTICERVNEV